MTAVHGVVEPGFEVRDAFGEAVRPGSGAAVAVRLHGRPIVDLWAGEAGAEEPWREDTLSVVFSCTKGLVSLLAARLVQEGLLDYDARVADYWPEFAAAGKADVRVQDLLAHRAGLSAPASRSTADLADWDLVAGRLAEQEPCGSRARGTPTTRSRTAG